MEDGTGMEDEMEEGMKENGGRTGMKELRNRASRYFSFFILTYR